MLVQSLATDMLPASCKTSWNPGKLRGEPVIRHLVSFFFLAQRVKDKGDGVQLVKSSFEGIQGAGLHFNFHHLVE